MFLLLCNTIFYLSVLVCCVLSIAKSTVSELTSVTKDTSISLESIAHHLKYIIIAQLMTRKF